MEILIFEERGKAEYPEKNLSGQRNEPITNSTHKWRRRRESLEPGPLWWEAGACYAATAPAPQGLERGNRERKTRGALGREEKGLFLPRLSPPLPFLPLAHSLLNSECILSLYLFALSAD